MGDILRAGFYLSFAFFFWAVEECSWRTSIVKGHGHFCWVLVFVLVAVAGDACRASVFCMFSFLLQEQNTASWSRASHAPGRLASLFVRAATQHPVPACFGPRRPSHVKFGEAAWLHPLGSGAKPTRRLFTGWPLLLPCVVCRRCLFRSRLAASLGQSGAGRNDPGAATSLGTAREGA